MKNNLFTTAMLLSLLTSVSSCSVIGGIFKTGVGVGVFIVVVILVIVLLIFGRKK